MFVIEYCGRQVGDKVFTDLWEAMREAEALDDMFPDRVGHDVARVEDFKEVA